VTVLGAVTPPDGILEPERLDETLQRRTMINTTWALSVSPRSPEGAEGGSQEARGDCSRRTLRRETLAGAWTASTV
jgi:hypothetical protein